MSTNRAIRPGLTVAQTRLSSAGCSFVNECRSLCYWLLPSKAASCAGKLKEECTVIVVSHDLREIAPLVDVAWEMQPNGTLSAQQDVSQIGGVPV